MLYESKNQIFYFILGNVINKKKMFLFFVFYVAQTVAEPTEREYFSVILSGTCYWKFYIQNSHYSIKYGLTTLECMKYCLETEGCTGFEAPRDQSYCAPWLYGACSGVEAAGFNANKEEAGHDLYIRKPFPYIGCFDHNITNQFNISNITKKKENEYICL